MERDEGNEKRAGGEARMGQCDVQGDYGGWCDGTDSAGMFCSV